VPHHATSSRIQKVQQGELLKITRSNKVQRSASTSGAGIQDLQERRSIESRM
jgi:hypothetical protein